MVLPHQPSNYLPTPTDTESIQTPQTADTAGQDLPACTVSVAAASGGTFAGCGAGILPGNTETGSVRNLSANKAVVTARRSKTDRTVRTTAKTAAESAAGSDHDFESRSGTHRDQPSQESFMQSRAGSVRNLSENGAVFDAERSMQSSVTISTHKTAVSVRKNGQLEVTRPA